MTLRRSATPLEEENTAQAMIVLLDTIEEILEKNKNIKFEVLMSAMWTFIIEWHVQEGLTYEKFCHQLEAVKEHFKLLQGQFDVDISER